MCLIAHMPHNPVPYLDLYIIKQHTSSGYMSHVPLDLNLTPACDELRWFNNEPNIKICQVVQKMSNVKKSNTWTMKEVHKK